MRIALPALALLTAATCTATSAAEQHYSLLVFTRTAGYVHASIPAGVAALKSLGARSGFDVDATADAAAFRDDNLKRYAAVVFLSTTGDVLDDAQQAAFERYVRGGGGFVGIHSASDTEYEWPWYGRLVGAYFASHPKGTPTATVRIVDADHPSTAGLPAAWERTDEWYDWKALPQGVRILAKVDESTYSGGKMGADHPVAWCHDFDGGRAFYTAMGHTEESYSDPRFLDHVLGGIRYAVRAGTPR
ncbi:MAG TPA: ThuA domain-containing protein [Vicinamibacteria bacterium]|jgi:type 1 glutamine amidotransferase